MVDETPGSNDWDADDYDDDHSFVYEYGSDVLELLAPESGERILDLGCGTGHLTVESRRPVRPRSASTVPPR